MNFQRAYRLRPIEAKADDFVAQLRVGAFAGRQNVLLPYAIGLGYFVVPTSGADVSIEATDFRLARLGLLASLWVRLRLALLFKKKKYLKFKGFSIFSIGPKPQRKRFTTFNQHMFNIGVSLDGDLIAAHPELLDGWVDNAAHERATPRHAAPARHAGPSATAVIVHIYYEETWADIAGVLKRLTIPFDLIVTTVPGREGLIEAIRRDFPDADVEAMENRGRDVRPFLVLLEKGRLDRYRYVCKVHGKKSSDGGRKSYMGAIWRRRLLFDLLAAPGLAASILDMFERDPSVGMIGPRAFRLPGETYSEELSWSVNRKAVLELAGKMGVPDDQFRLDFFGGTMFWVRPEALTPLRKLKLSEAFPEEKGLLDGGLEHAVERLFAAAVVAGGYRLADSEGFGAAGGDPGRPAPYARGSVETRDQNESHAQRCRKGHDERVRQRHPSERGGGRVAGSVRCGPVVYRGHQDAGVAAGVSSRRGSRRADLPAGCAKLSARMRFQRLKREKLSLSRLVKLVAGLPDLAGSRFPGPYRFRARSR